MKRLANSTIAAVKGIADIVGIIQDYVKLKRRGRHYIGLCPFHSERTPSFTVSPDKRLWHCFGCQESGDHIGFIMKIDHMGFTDAIEHLATRHGISVDWEETGDHDPEKAQFTQSLRQALSIAKSHYHRHLSDSAIRYLTTRGIAKELIDHFSIGYAPFDASVVNALRESGLSDSVIAQTGLIVQRGDQLQDRFSGRIVFPILDDRGRAIGMGGRIIDDSGGAKYLNSDETQIFAKRRVLFGLDKAKSAIRKRECALIMEGYLDVVVAHQYGLTHSVAALGTAFSIDHARLLSRFTQTVITAMDQDEAGATATERIYDHCATLGLTVRVTEFDNKDPADCLTTFGIDHFETCVANSISFTEFKFKRLLRQYPDDRIETKAKLIDDMIPYLLKEKDLVIQRHYARRVAATLKIDSDLILSKLTRFNYPNRKSVITPTQFPKKTKFELAEEFIIYVMATNLDARIRLLAAVTIADFQNPLFQTLILTMCEYPMVDAELVDAIPDETTRRELRRVLVEHAQTQTSVDDCVQTLRRHPIEARIQAIKAQLRLESIDDTQSEQLLAELQGLVLQLDVNHEHPAAANPYA